MSHEVVFLPHILGQTWAQALAAARTAAREEDPRIVAARLEPWPDLVLHAAQILGQIEEFRGRGQRELVHPVTRLRFTFFGEDAVIALPYWYDGPVARMAATMAFRFAHAVESDTGLAAYDPQQRTPLAEMGLEKFVAGYLRGRERALEQPQARGPVPVGHALPTGRSAGRRELAAGPSAAGARGAGGGGAGAAARPGDDAGRTRREGSGAPRQGADAARPQRGAPRQGTDAGRPTDAARLRPAGKPVRSAEAGGRGAPAGPRPGSDQRQPANPSRRESGDARQAADSGPIAGSGGWLRRGKPGRGEQVPRSGKVVEPRKAPRRGEPSDADPAQRTRRAPDPNAARRGERSDPNQQQPPRRTPDSDTPRRRDADQGQRSGRGAEPRKMTRRERAEAEQAQRSRKPQRDDGSDWSLRPGRPDSPRPPEPRRAPPPDRERRPPPDM